MPLGRVHILEDRSLRLDTVELSDQGEYSCEADNTVGSVTATGILKVHCKRFSFIELFVSFVWRNYNQDLVIIIIHLTIFSSTTISRCETYHTKC